MYSACKSSSHNTEKALVFQPSEASLHPFPRPSGTLPYEGLELRFESLLRVEWGLLAHCL